MIAYSIIYYLELLSDDAKYSASLRTANNSLDASFLISFVTKLYLH